MFLPDYAPVLCNLPEDISCANVYFVHDLHFGSTLFDSYKWAKLKKAITSEDNAFVVWVGDLMENAIPGSKSDMFTQTHPPAVQREWVAEQLLALSQKTIAVVPGNHCSNRTTKTSGLYPLYDCCLLAGIGDKYRNTYAIIDIGIGRKGNGKQLHYFGQVQHRAKDIKTVHSADYTDGIDFFASGHDHEPKDKPRAKLVYDPRNKIVTKRNVECINCGSFCSYGGYGVEAAMRPQSDKMWMLRLFGGETKRMETVGFYV